MTKKIIAICLVLLCIIPLTAICVSADTPIQRSLYYSKYDPSKFNTTSTPVIGSTTELIQYRMNCYGYAFCNILYGSATYDTYGGYKQQPGEFAATADKGNTVNNMGSTPADSHRRIVANMRLDASRFGYTMANYIPYSGIIPQYGNISRMIALVVGNTDYHFYMQHSDGTWSHKPGSSQITNRSLSTNVVLTNDNIVACAAEGIYQGGYLSFFVITKTAVIDQPHGARCCLSWPCSHTQSALYHRDKAGDYLQTSLVVGTGVNICRFDFSNDHDVFCFIPSATGSYTATSIIMTSGDIDCDVYDEYGNLLASDYQIGELSLTLTLTKNKAYYFDVHNYTSATGTYKFFIN